MHKHKLSMLAYSALTLATITGQAKAAPAQGTLDITENIECKASGWTRDPNSPNPIWVDFYRDAPYGQPGAVWVGGSGASTYRGDLPYTDKNHGFSFAFSPMTSGLYDGQSHYIYAYGVPGGATGTTPALLAGSPKAIRCPVLVTPSANSGDDKAIAIQTAINKAGANGAVYFSPGTYWVGTQNGSAGQYPKESSTPYQPIYTALNITSANLTLLAPPDRSAIIKLMPYKRMRILTAQDGGSNLTVKNLVFDGNKMNRRASDQNGTGWGYGDVVDALLYGSHLPNSYNLQNIEIRDGLEDGAGCWYCSNVSISNSSFLRNGVEGSGGLGIAFTGNGANFSGNVISGQVGHGIGATVAATNVTISNNTITNNTGGAILLGGEGSSFNFTITGNTLRGNGADGFAAIEINNATSYGSKNIISGNVIEDNRVGIRISGTSSMWSITGNRVSDTSSNLKQEKGIWLGFGGPSNIEILSNTVKSNGFSLSDQIFGNTSAISNGGWPSQNTLAFP